MNHQNVKNLINILALSEDKKQELIDEVDQSGITEDLMAKIKIVLIQMRQAIQKEFPEESKAWGEIQAEIRIQEAKALEELDKELTELDEEVKTTTKNFSEELDQIDLKATRQSLEK